MLKRINHLLGINRSKMHLFNPPINKMEFKICPLLASIYLLISQIINNRLFLQSTLQPIYSLLNNSSQLLKITLLCSLANLRSRSSNSLYGRLPVSRMIRSQKRIKLFLGRPLKLLHKKKQKIKSLFLRVVAKMNKRQKRSSLNYFPFLKHHKRIPLHHKPKQM